MQKKKKKKKLIAIEKGWNSYVNSTNDKKLVPFEELSREAQLSIVSCHSHIMFELHLIKNEKKQNKKRQQKAPERAI